VVVLVLVLGCAGRGGNGNTTTGTGGVTSGAGGAAAAAGAGGNATGGAGASAGGSGGATSDAGATVAYRIDPPDPCYDQFFATGCMDGVATSTCGGRCTVANACSPPESPNKSALPKTFVCPRFMLSSDEMLQAAADDTRANSWGDPANPPFNYAVGGHDPDTGGLDAQPSSCCQCYQLVFETPESGSPQPPGLPIPKPLILQSINTSAGGGKNFDVFMGAGGYGAFNACVNDPSFGGTTQFGSFMYSSFPGLNPNNGGVKFMDFDECKDSTKGTVTVASLQSTACQSRISGLCAQAQAISSSAVTATTQRSCLMSNQLASLYHQNWQVRARKVECPEALTRVTGCRLQPAGLPAPDPTVQTAAAADATFKTGYGTTTMQDCCKPTCSWSDDVAGMGLSPSGPWRAFYSCDANGTPFTAPAAP
ncbi:MAG TPA: hypothetical protein VIF57_30200, partial [Polyangia bacterium]